MSAVISPCGLYRYALYRDGNPALQPTVFVMLNPSTADAAQDDPTIRRLYTFARGAPFVVVNLYAWRSASPKDMFAVADFVDIAGPENAAHLATVAAMGCKIVAAWGAHAKQSQVQAFMDICAAFGAPVYCLGMNSDGSPKHPLYVPSDTPMVPWTNNYYKPSCFVCDGEGCLTCQRVR